MEEQIVNFRCRAGQNGHHLEANSLSIIVLSQKFFEGFTALWRIEKGQMLFNDGMVFIGQAHILKRQRGAVGLVFMTLKEQIQKPVIRVGRSGARHVDQEPGMALWMAQDAHLHAEFVFLDPDLLHSFGGEGFKLLFPFLCRVIPEDEALSAKDLTKAVMDSLHQSSSLAANPGIGARALPNLR